MNNFSTSRAYVRLEDFSREALINLIRVYTRLYMAVDGFWYLAVKDRVNNDAALACDIDVWRRLCRYEMKHLTQAFNITGKDLRAMVNTLEMTPWLQNSEYQFEFIDSRTVRMTVTACPILFALEKEGEGREAQICRTVEPVMLESYASFFDNGKKKAIFLVE